MKRIAFVAHGLGIGGAQRVAVLLANRFASDGYKVGFIVTRSEEEAYCLNNNVQLIKRVPSKGFLQSVLKNIYTYQALKKFKPDLIISFLTNEMVISGLCVKCPQIYSLRNDPNNDMNSFFRRNVRNILYRKANAIVFQTEGARKYFIDDIQRKGVIIENPITEGLPFWSEQRHEKKIITACRLEKQKNVSMLIKAFALFVLNHQEYRLVVCGKGSLLNELEALCQRLDIRDKVEFMGFRTDVHELMKTAEMFVISSNYEGLSNSMLEALAIGIPTISTDSPPGGAAQFIDNGTNGILVPVGEVGELAKAMITIAENRNIRNKLSKNAKTIRDELSIEKVYIKWKVLVDKLT